jgi:uncharacterized membrane protein
LTENKSCAGSSTDPGLDRACGATAHRDSIQEPHLRISRRNTKSDFQKTCKRSRIGAAGTFGSTLALYGARQLSVFGTAVATLGTAILTRALTNMDFKRLTGIGAGRRAVTIHKIINVAAPVEEFFAFWSDYQNFPRFMSNVRDVKLTGEKRSHWIVAGPAGAAVEWDAVITNYVPNQSFGWKTESASPIQHAGIVKFEPNSDGSTRNDIKMSYNPVAGALGHAVAAIFCADPKDGNGSGPSADENHDRDRKTAA